MGSYRGYIYVKRCDNVYSFMRQNIAIDETSSRFSAKTCCNTDVLDIHSTALVI